jgi:hypothetical protein
MVEQLRDDVDLRRIRGLQYLDLQDILPGEPWRERTGEHIEPADTVVFALSPNSVASRIVDWEVKGRNGSGKRILPAVAIPDRVPGALGGSITFSCVTTRSGRGLKKLDNVLRTDIDWICEYTRLGERAADWERGARPDEQLLCRAASCGRALDIEAAF